MDHDRFRIDFLKDQIRIASDEKTAATLFEKVGMRGSETMMDIIQEARLVDEASDALNDPLFGMRAGLAFTRSTTLTGYVARYSRTIESAVRHSRKVNRYVFPSYDFSLNVSGNAATVRLDALDERLLKYHQHRELLIFGLLAYFRSISDRNFYPFEVRLTHNVGTRADKIRKLAGFPVSFGAENLEVILPLSVLEIPIPTYEPILRDHLVAYSERLLADRPTSEPSLRARIEGILTNGLPDRLVPAEEVASNLGMSARTMGRRLKEDSLTFREIVDDLRLALARTYLKNGISVTEVAFLLDYSDTAAFSTAFKRWTNQSPRQFAKTKS